MKILRRPEVEALTGLSRSTIYANIAKRTFPKQVQLSSRAVGWKSDDIEQWMADLVPIHCDLRAA